jgi:hypothetical protein
MKARVHRMDTVWLIIVGGGQRKGRKRVRILIKVFFI